MPENHVQWPRNNGRTFRGVVAGGRSPTKLEAVDRVDDGFGKKPLAVAALLVEEGARDRVDVGARDRVDWGALRVVVGCTISTSTF